MRPFSRSNLTSNIPTSSQHVHVLHPKWRYFYWNVTSYLCDPPVNFSCALFPFTSTQDFLALSHPPPPALSEFPQTSASLHSDVSGFPFLHPQPCKTLFEKTFAPASSVPCRQTKRGPVPVPSRAMRDASRCSAYDTSSIHVRMNVSAVEGQ